MGSLVQTEKVSVANLITPSFDRRTPSFYKEGSYRKIHQKQNAPKVKPIEKFKRISRLVVICVRLCKYSHDSVSADKAEYLSVIQVSQDFQQLDRGGLYFDPNDFRANKQERIPQEARRILHLQPQERTNRDITYLQIVLRGIKAFAEYPQKMQKQLCQVGWYESYEPQRAIVRQNHPPHSFYFILCGSVIVTAFDKDNGGTKLLVSLHRGMSFGELAVITRSRRQATVSTQTSTELLCISAEDFEEIFMSGGIKHVTDPDHNEFIRNISFLKHWPIHLLASNPQACMFHYFNRGQVLVRDSNESDWIYIVKSGSLSVLKKLKEVQPQSDQEQAEAAKENIAKKAAKNGKGKRKSFSSLRHRYYMKRRKPSKDITRPHSDSDKEIYNSQYELEKRLEETLPGYHNVKDRLGVINYDAIINEHKSRLQTKTSEGVKLPPLVNGGTPQSEVTESEDEVAPSIEGSKFKLPQIRKTSKGVYFSANRQHRKVSKKEKEENIQEEIEKRQIELSHKRATQEEGRKTIAEQFDNKPVTSFKLTAADLHPMFILVQILERGQYFGVHSIISNEEQPSFSVMSNGAECIMISKRFFRDKATDVVKRNLEQTENRFPSDKVLQNSLQNYVNWESNRRKIYLDVVNEKYERRQRRKQYLPQYQGQYSFRAGPS